jgi:hypothetical protein
MHTVASSETSSLSSPDRHLSSLASLVHLQNGQARRHSDPTIQPKHKYLSDTNADAGADTDADKNTHSGAILKVD